MRRVLATLLALVALATSAQAGGYTSTPAFPGAITPRGPKGDRGCAVLPTNGPPAAEFGSDCDFAFDAGSGVVWGPKASGQWAVSVTMSPVMAARAIAERTQLDRMAAQAARDAATASAATASDAEQAATAAAASATSAAGTAATILTGTARTDQSNTWGPAQSFSAPPVLPLAQGSLPFIGAGGVLSQDNGALYWDAANQRLGLGTTTPRAPIHYSNPNYAPTATNFEGNPSGVPNGVGTGLFTLVATRTGGAGQYGHAFVNIDVTAPMSGVPGERTSDTVVTGWISARNTMEGGRLNGAWFGANSPAVANGHAFTAGQVTAMELNAGMLGGDKGIATSFGAPATTTGLVIAPDPVPRTGVFPTETTTVTVGTPAVFHKTGHGYAAGMGIEFFGAQAAAAGLTEGGVYYIISAGMTADDYQVSTMREGAPLALAGSPTGSFNARPSWPGTFGLVLAPSVHGHQVGTQIHIREDSVRPGGFAMYVRGSTAASALDAPSALLSGQNNFSRGIDLNAMTFVNDAIRLADDHIIRLGSATVRGLGAGSLNLSTLGTGTTGRLLANGGAQEVIRWGANSTPAPILSFYGATPVPRPVVSGSRGGNAALASLAAALDTLGLVTDSTTP